MPGSNTFASIDSALSTQQRRFLIRENLSTDVFDTVLESSSLSTHSSEEISLLIEEFFKNVKKSWLTADAGKKELLGSTLKVVLAGDIVNKDQAKRLLLAFSRLEPVDSAEESDCSVTDSVKFKRIPKKEERAPACSAASGGRESSVEVVAKKEGAAEVSRPAARIRAADSTEERRGEKRAGSPPTRPGFSPKKTVFQVLFFIFFPFKNPKKSDIFNL